MKIAVKFWSQADSNPQENPSYWPWKQQTIADELQESFEGLGWTVYTADAFKAYLESKQKDFDVWFNNREILANSSRLRVYGLVQNKFKDFHPSKIDFTIHLQPNVCLQKVKTMMANGRPDKSEYYYNDQKICEIVFEFTVDQLNFMTRRKEKLGYVNGAGEITEYFYIYDQTFSYSIDTQFAEMISERAQARAIIFDSIKAICSGYLTQYYMTLGQTYAQVLTLLGAFWESYSNIIDAWINTGTPDLEVQLDAETNFPMLDVTLPGAVTGLENNMTVREYVIFRLNY